MADVVDLLLAEHALVEDLFRETLASTGTTRDERFAELVRVLAVHEAAEEAVVHPLAHSRIDSPALIDGRLEEEARATRMMTELVQMGTGAVGFESALMDLRLAVLIHARHEERYEFTSLRHQVPAVELVAAAAALRTAEGTPV